MSRNLCDETFPASLLIEFDELDDEIPISPEFPKRQQPATGLSRHRSTLRSTGKGIASDKTDVTDRSGSRMVISGSSNTSSGHSSLSTEGENRSASSDRDTSRDQSKAHRTPEVAGPGAMLLLGGGGETLNIRQPRSMESLLPLTSNSASSLGPGTGLGSTGNVSVGSVGADTKPQHYHRHRAKYGHVQSKVKQMINEMKPPNNRDRKTLVRHKSMPDTSFDVGSKEVEEDALGRVNDVETVRAVAREMQQRMSSLEQQLSLCQADMFNELAALKCKNSALRFENDHLLEQERAREQRRQLLLRDQPTGTGSCYGSQSSLNKATAGLPPSTTSTVGTQTSPIGTYDSQFEFLFVSPPVSPPPHVLDDAPESTLGEFSPDYEQLLPRFRRRDTRRTPTVHSPTEHPDHALDGDPATAAATTTATSPACHDCRRRKKKRKTRKQKLASLFCIRHHDESL
uniref:Uncharacterized protein n=1 Tax=Anopheles dirus TaxID=7168 RepID=A0A182N3H8_9DIPT